MKITYLLLKNVAGIYVGMNKNELEIKFDKAINKITAIIGENGKGKSVLISSLTPFASPTSLDERSTLSYILQHKDGYKEIHYVDGKDSYIIKHYFKATKDTHTVKSYFMKNGEELNENGNVTSFNALVEIHFGLTQEMMRLIRIGTNVSSFISLTPAKRKEYIGKLIEEIDMYLKIYKKITDDMKVVKVLTQTNNTNLYNCHIQDIVLEEENLDKMYKDILKSQKERDEILSKITEIDTLIKGNDIEDLKRKKHEAESSLNEFAIVENKMKGNNLLDTSVDDLIKLRSKYSNLKVEYQSKINSYRIAIDSSLKNIERLETSIKKVTSEIDIQSLLNTLNKLHEDIDHTPKIVKVYKSNGMTSDEIKSILNKLQSFNQTSKMIYSLGNKSLKMYIKLKNEGKNIDDWLKDKNQQLKNQIKSSDLDLLIDQMFKDDAFISPICSSDLFDKCPYYRFHDIINKEKNKLDSENIDNETLHYISIINNNIDTILNELDVIKLSKLPGSIKDQFNESAIINRLNKNLALFDLTDLEEYLSLVTEWEIYVKTVDTLAQYEQQLSIYKKAGIDSQVGEIDKQNEQISYYRDEIQNLNKELEDINNKLEEVDNNIVILTKYNESKKYKKMFESTLESTEKILAPLETASNNKMELEFSLRETNNLINLQREQHHQLEIKINEYKRLVEESERLSKVNNDLSIIQEAVSTKKGIPVFYMKKYLGKIQKFANELLSIIYEDEFKLSAFNVTPETFEVPYIKNGKKIPDIKYSSQSEIALATMALSFSLANSASNKYNILLLDEIDGGLDDQRRSAFLKMLYLQMEKLNAEQVFIISHNLSQMTNVPMDCINLTENTVKSKLQNIIYE